MTWGRHSPWWRTTGTASFLTCPPGLPESCLHYYLTQVTERDNSSEDSPFLRAIRRYFRGFAPCGPDAQESHLWALGSCAVRSSHLSLPPLPRRWAVPPLQVPSPTAGNNRRTSGRASAGFPSRALIRPPR